MYIQTMWNFSQSGKPVANLCGYLDMKALSGKLGPSPKRVDTVLLLYCVVV